MRITRPEAIEKPLREIIEKAINNAPKRNFEESVECTIVVRDIDLRRPENRFRTFVKLPYDVAKIDKIGVFADGRHLTEIQSADFKDIILEVVDKAKLEVLRSRPRMAKKMAKKFRIFVASATMMAIVARYIAKYLAARNKMPIPVPPNKNMIDAVKEAKRTVAIRLSTTPQIATKIGYRSLPIDHLVENALALINSVINKLPNGFRNISDIYIKTTMGPAYGITVG
ncbi:MAG: 50S ribosomal protein L1 [Candidatus Njordarchaeota archaeon]